MNYKFWNTDKNPVTGWSKTRTNTGHSQRMRKEKIKRELKQAEKWK